MSRLYTLLIGIAFLLLAVLGIIPGDSIVHKLRKLFSLNFFNQIFYFILGITALMCWLKGERAPLKFLGFTGFLLIFLGMVGFITAGNRLFHLFTVNFTDNLLHLTLGVFILFLTIISYKK